MHPFGSNVPNGGVELRTHAYGSKSSGFAGNRVCTWLPHGTGAARAIGWDFTETGTVSSESLGDASFRTQVPRVRYQAPSVLFGRGALVSKGPIGWRGLSPRSGGFQFTIRFALAANVTNTSAFVGLSDSASPVLSGTTFGANSIGVGFNGSSATSDPWKVVVASSSSTTLISTANTATRNTTSVYELVVTCPPCTDGVNEDPMTLRLVDLSTGTVLVDDFILKGALAPLPSAFLYAHAEVFTVFTGQPAIEIVSMRVEVPDLAPSTGQDLGANGIFNVKDFGAVGDFNGTTGTNDSPAFQATLRAMRGKGGTVIIPPGKYLLADGLAVAENLTGPVVVRGAAPGTPDAASQLHFPIFQGLRVIAEQPELAPLELPIVSAIVVENLALFGGHTGGADHERATEWPVWAVVHELGDRVVTPGPRLAQNIVAPATENYPDASFEYFYECIYAGVSAGATMPDFAAAYRPDRSVLHQINKKYFRGQIVRGSGFFDRVFICTTEEGTTSGTVPTWPAIGSTVVDGGVTWHAMDGAPYFVAQGGTLASPGTGYIWACRVSAGIYSELRVSLRQIWIQDFFNAAVHVQEPITNWYGVGIAEGSAGYDLRLIDCGVGLVLREGADLGVFMNVHIQTPLPPENAEPEVVALYDRCLGIVDRSRRGNQHFAPWVSSAGPAVVVNGNNLGGLHGLLLGDVAGPLDLRSPDFAVWGGNVGTNILPTSTFYGATAPNDWRNVVTRIDAAVPTGYDNSDPPEVVTTASSLSEQLQPDPSSVLGMAVELDAGSYRYVYGLPEPGYWGMTYGEGTVAYAIAGGTASAPAGFVWFPQGILVGAGTARNAIRTSGDPPDFADAVHGDIAFHESPGPGDPIYWQYTGYVWLPGPLVPVP